MFGKRDIRNLSVGDRVWLTDGIDEMIVIDLLPLLNSRVMVTYTANRLSTLMVCNMKDILKINGKDVER